MALALIGRGGKAMASKELVLGDLMRKQSLSRSLELLAHGYPEGITGVANCPLRWSLPSTGSLSLTGSSG